MFFYAFVRKIPMGYGMTCAAVYGDFFIDLSRETPIPIAKSAFPESVFHRLSRTQKRAAKFLSFAARS